MKYLLFIMAILLSFGATADQRFESDGGYCHFAYDTNDDDNEVYFANCINTIDTYDAADGQGRLAMGDTNVKKHYTVRDKTYIAALEKGNIYLKGNQTGESYGNYDVSNAPCVMVTANYDAGNDDQNETVYVTNDWNLEIRVYKREDDSFEKGNLKVTYNLACRNGIAQ